MEIKCEYCNGNFEDTLENCPHCGASNANIRRMVDKTPKTIEELAQWYKDRNLPPYETTRFFIGIDYTAPKAFGIYRDGNEIVVYKNKDTGERAIRYRGTDEAYAVNELFLKLKSEILNQKAGNINRTGSSGAGKPKKGSCLFTVLITIALFAGIVVSVLLDGAGIALVIAIVATIIACVVLSTVEAFKKLQAKKISWLIYPLVFILTFTIAFIPIHRYSAPRYYNYDDTIYCRYHGSYYTYDDYYDDYYPIGIEALPVEIRNNSEDYAYNWNNESWDDRYSFKDSDYYDENFSSSSDSDSDYDWDSDSSWDSGGSDWGSDW